MTDKRMRRDAATILLFGSALALATAIFIGLSGGVTLRTPPLTLRGPVRPLGAGLALFAAAWLVAGPGFAALVRPYFGSRARVPARVAALASACTLVFAIAWAARAAGGGVAALCVVAAG